MSPCKSAATALIGRTGDETTRSGFPKLHSAPVGNCRGGGASAGFPCGAPLSTHLAMFAISASLSERSSLNLLDADVPLDEPRRHVARRRPAFDRARPRPRLLVGEQRHRRHRPWPMAALAGPLKDGRDVLGERRARAGLSGRGDRRCRAEEACCQPPGPHARRRPTPTPCSTHVAPPSRARRFTADSRVSWTYGSAAVWPGGPRPPPCTRRRSTRCTCRC